VNQSEDFLKDWRGMSAEVQETWAENANFVNKTLAARVGCEAVLRDDLCAQIAELKFQCEMQEEVIKRLREERDAWRVDA
jgi:hypothetical protein